MIDFHTHILPGIDDGSRSIEKSLEMLRTARDSGIDTVVATPHFYPERENPESFLSRREEAIRKLQVALTPDLPQICIGAEVAFFDGISRSDRILGLGIEGTGLILVEMPFMRWSASDIEEICSVYPRLGLTPIIAHIERYMDYQHAGTLPYLIKNGILIQSNGEFFLDKRTQSRACRMLKNNMVHLLGSDCHDPEARPENLGAAMEYILKRKGTDDLRRVAVLGEKIMSAAETIAVPAVGVKE